MEPGGLMPRSQGSPIIIPILSRINPIPYIDTYLFIYHPNILTPSTPRRPYPQSRPVDRLLRFAHKGPRNTCRKPKSANTCWPVSWFTFLLASRNIMLHSVLEPSQRMRLPLCHMGDQPADCAWPREHKYCFHHRASRLESRASLCRKLRALVQ